LYNDILADA